MSIKFLKDLGERMFWTAAQGALSVIAVDQFDWAKGWAVPIMFGLAALKGIIAKHVGNGDSASTVPSI